MSIAVYASSEAALAEQSVNSATKKPPPKRQIVARADQVSQPEPR